MKKNAELPDDLIINILCKLPLQDAIRFTGTCKAWKHILHDCCIPNIKNQSAGILLFNTKQGHGYYELNAVSRNPDFGRYIVHPREPVLPSKLIDCCNGLLLLRPLMEIEEYKVLRWGRQFASVIYNPINKQFVQIPEAPYKPKRAVPPDVLDAVLAFDPRISHHFKVVQFEYGPSNICYVFSSETWDWSMLVFGFVIHGCRGEKPPKCFYLDGAVYRLCSTGSLVRISIDAAINSRDRIRAIRLPLAEGIHARQMVRMGILPCIGVNKENNILLGMADYDLSVVEIWMLGDEYNWVLKHTISFQTIQKSRGIIDVPYSFFPCAFDPISHKVFLCSQKENGVESMHRKILVAYDLNTQESEQYSSISSLARFFPFVPCINVHMEGKHVRYAA